MRFIDIWKMLNSATSGRPDLSRIMLPKRKAAQSDFPDQAEMDQLNRIRTEEINWREIIQDASMKRHTSSGLDADAYLRIHPVVSLIRRCK